MQDRSTIEVQDKASHRGKYNKGCHVISNPMNFCFALLDSQTLDLDERRAAVLRFQVQTNQSDSGVKLPEINREKNRSKQ